MHNHTPCIERHPDISQTNDIDDDEEVQYEVFVHEDANDGPFQFICILAGAQ